MRGVENSEQFELPPASLVTAPLSEKLVEKLHLLQAVYAEEFGPDHLVLPDDLYATFAKLVVPSPTNTESDIIAKVEQTRPQVLIAMEQIVVKASSLFPVSMQYDDITTKGNWLDVQESEPGKSQTLQNLFNAVSRVTPNGAVAARPVMFKDSVDLSHAERFTRANVRRHFRGDNSPITNLQLREFSPKTRKPEITEEFTFPKN